MTEFFALLLVLACVVGILLFMTGVLRARSRPAATLGGFASYHGPRQSTGVLGGLVGAVAVASAGSVVGAGSVSPAVLGSILGVMFAVLRVTGAHRVFGWMLALCGLIGLGAAAIGLFASAGCSPITIPVRIAVLVLLAGCVVLGAVGAAVRARLRVRSVLAVFGAVRIVTFLASPLGISLVQLPWIAWAVAFGAAALFGFAAWMAPDFVIGTTALALSIGAIVAAATLGSPCSTGGDPAELLVVVAYLVAFGLVSVAAGGVLRRAGVRA